MTLDELRQLIAANAYWFGGLSFFLGLLLGHWLALGRDRRNDLNAALVPVRAALVKCRDRPSPMCPMPSAVELDLVEHFLPARNRRALRQAVARCDQEREAQQTRDSYGGAFYKEPGRVQAQIDAMLAQLQLR